MFFNDRKCKECGIKLSTRNLTSRSKAFSNLCQRCFTHPKSEHRCHAKTTLGKRCKFRITGDSKKLCKIHSSRLRE